ncbi:hypothetical protein ABKV19_000082 [Rosa sericea]
MPNPKPQRPQSTRQVLGMPNCLLLLRLQWRELESISRRRKGLTKLQVLKQMKKTRENCQCRAWILWDLGLPIRRRVEHCQLGWFQSQTILLRATCLRLRFEIIVGDSSNFGAATPKPQGDDPPDLYKPKVSSWGVFPRPNDISKTFGGGRVICPGEVLETQEEKAAKEERTRQLVAAYNTKMGLNIYPKLILDCEKTLKDGDSLMNVGKLKESLPYYEKVMDKLPFKVMLLAHV